MEWALLLVALALVVGLGVQRAAPRSGPTSPAVAPAPGHPARPRDTPGRCGPPILPPEDEQDIEQLFAVVDREATHHLLALLEIRLHDVIHRQVPVRGIRASPAPHVARICFSNGVVVLATTRRPGDLVAMAAAMLRTSVTLRAYEVTPEGPALHFGWRCGAGLEVVAVGLDQAD